MYLRFRKYLALLLATPILAIGAIVCTSAQAAICFLPDCGDQTSTTNPNVDAEKCRNEGYESYQNRVCHQYSIVEFCPYNSDYIKCNNKEWCTINDYTKTECEEPYELFDKCPNGELMYKECKMNMEEACKAEDPTYTDTCPAGWVIDPEDHCSFSEDYGHCCNTCPGFISEEELGDKTAVATCDSCDGKKYIAADDGFNMCEGYWDCQDGCAPDAKTCVSFGITKCDKCNRCESRCTHETCPENAICEYEACTWRYCIIGCPEGYTNYCEAPFTSNCDLLGYTSTPNDCNGSTMLECPFDDNRVMCVNDDGSCCAVCADFPDETVKPGYIATDTCTCCGKKKYKTTINPCSGYKECTYGGTENSLSCQSGDRLLFQQCKECPNACPGNDTCPEGSICEYDVCSETYCAIACKTGYIKYCSYTNTDCRDLGYSPYDAAECAGKVVVYCPYDKNWVHCEIPEDGTDCCRNCQKLPYKDSLPYGYMATETCRCCGEVYYDGVPNPCEGYQECPFGGAEGATSCTTPDGVRYSACKECSGGCPGNSSCPAGAVCQYDSCSKTYCPTGCKSGYKNYCRTPNTDCRSLGYYRATSCWTQNTVKCPYDTDYVFCY